MKNFIPSEALNNAVENKDFIGVKSAFNSYFIKSPVDKHGETVKAFDFIKSKLPEIIEEYKVYGKFIEDKTIWSEDYFSDACVDLKENFCEKRFKHVLEVGKHVFAHELNESEAEDLNQSRKSTTSVKATDNKVVKTIITVVATAAAIGVSLYLLFRNHN